MANKRHFLGWDRPALPSAVAWLSDQVGEPSGWNLHPWLVVVPVARAGRRLLELLTERSEQAGGGLIPPDICTVGELPDRLCPLPSSGWRLASDSRAMLTRAEALRQFDREPLAELVPHPPENDDALGWWRLAERLRRVSDELATGLLTFEDVMERQTQGRLMLPRPERWQTLRAVDQAYHELLAADHLIDRQRHRLQTVRQGQCRCEQKIMLLGAPDLGAMAHALLTQLEASLTVLIHAPEAHAAGFDDLGAMVGSYWRDRPVPMADASIRVIDRTTDQPGEVVAAIVDVNRQRQQTGQQSGQQAGQGALPPDQITVGLGDEKQGGAIRRAIERAARGSCRDRTGDAEDAPRHVARLAGVLCRASAAGCFRGTGAPSSGHRLPAHASGEYRSRR